MELVTALVLALAQHRQATPQSELLEQQLSITFS
jgi:hypothetical protein